MTDVSPDVMKRMALGRTGGDDAARRAVGQREFLCGWLQATRNPFFCFEQALIAFSFSQKFLAFRSRLIFFRRLNFSGDRLIQFIERPMRYWFPAHAGFLAVADQNPSFTGCPTFTRQLTKLMRKKKNLSIISAGQLPPFHCDDPRPMGFPALANVTGLCAAAVPAFYKFNVVGIVDMLGDLPEVGRFHADAYRVLTLERHPDSTQQNPIQAVIGQFIAWTAGAI
jgi:hypothetical protein